MKRTKLFLLILIVFNANAFNQIIKGTVLDKQSRAPIDFAVVYFNGTFVGTQTDKNGCFELDISRNLTMPTSRIVVKEEYVLFDKRGFFDPLGILWEGEMAKQRIADLLPFEYSISIVEKEKGY
ncbi:MAG TPA: carboxypeptidase-like regulatory domain-containing protein [Bacteroidales bacterium]|nr:carboxypeptidase-like regulatory domain-containing protein [Bacteroidales bacterium]